MRAIWQAVLGHRDLEPGTNFFDAGGNSLLLVQLHTLLGARFPGVIQLSDLFAAATLQAQARLIAARAPAPAGALDPKDPLVALGGTGPGNLFCFAPGTGSSGLYYPLARRLFGWAVYGVEFPEGPRPAEVLADRLELAQPNGPFLLLGYSSGGNLAYEVALELGDRGRAVAGLVLLDSWRRLEPHAAPETAYRAEAGAFLGAVDPGFAAHPDPEAAIRRVAAYDRHLDSRREDRPVPWPIRLIQAEPEASGSPPPRFSREGWGELSPDFRILQGSGRHLQLLDPLRVDGTAELVQAALGALGPGNPGPASRNSTQAAPAGVHFCHSTSSAREIS